MASKFNILVFDSGVGGLSVVEQIQKKMPDLTIHYAADYAYFPYGVLDETTLNTRVSEVVANAIDVCQPSLVVIACNSASTLALPALRQSLDVDVVGVVPAVKPAAKISKSKVIALLATPGTIQRDYTDDLISEFAPDCAVIKCGSSELVTLAEAKLAGKPISRNELESHIAGIINHPQCHDIDTVVLACTHFPLLQTEFANAMPWVQHWIDSGEAVARRVESLLSKQSNSTTSKRENAQHPIFISSKAIGESQQQILAQYGFEQFKVF